MVPPDADDTDSNEPPPSDPPPTTTGPQVVYEFAVAADDLVFGGALDGRNQAAGESVEASPCPSW